MQYGMVIDLNKCVGCHACAVACKAEWEVPADKARSWVDRLGPAETPHGLASTYYPGLCNHCDRPSCVEVCPAPKVEKTFTDAETGKTKKLEVAATWKNPFNGTVQIDKDRCLGCGICAKACPYGARYVNQELVKADKCTYCMPRVEKGLQPACVQTCLAGARIFGDLDDPKSEVSQYVKKGAKGLTTKEVDIGPNSLYYGNKKDMHLLEATSAPDKNKHASLGRRDLLASLKPQMEKVGKAGFLGVAGAFLADQGSKTNKDG
ncbi:MAG: 4Fe-4S dicluster domain-containing protein [Desulfurivibrionaceae bacterium]